ncbi:MAG: hypothetical protein EZS28_018719 [Streblomastix strix]|uniref:Uncharacterized protein n=1 Tax=Streblomastix strix TaxID=222440 RepID=A0A5J4VT42_9EUKA|nr:MAG: hypothetical protein EZS28_018719 [Streblomastix strix]
MEMENNNINEQQITKPKRKYERKEGSKCGRPKKYETEEQAKSKAREQEPSRYETQSRQCYPSIAQNLILDQVSAQAIVKQILDNQVGVGDPTLIDISNVNARIAAGQPGFGLEGHMINGYGLLGPPSSGTYPKTNYNDLINLQSQNLGSNVLPLNQKDERELNIESVNEKEKEKELEKDKEFQASSDPVQQSDEVLLYPQKMKP